MNKTLFVNLSDIHVKQSNMSNIKPKFDTFVATISGIKKLGDYNKVIILVSGDISYSGKREEFELIECYFEELATSYDLIMCPGNHDHDFSKYESNVARNQILKLESEQQDVETIAICTKGLKSYNEFESSYTTFNAEQSTPLSKSFKIISGDKSINIATLNTAWCSQIHERGGDIFFPVKYLPDTDKNNINILFFHHPLSWFEPDNQKVIRNSTRDDYSIILTGHEHLNDNFKVVGETNSCLMIEAMPFDDVWVPDNGFITFELDNNDVNIKTYIWEDGKFEVNGSYNKQDILKSNSISNECASVNMDFYKGLIDIGVNYIHPDKDVLDLNDVFIYPNLKMLNEENKFDMRKSSSEYILGNEHKKILLIGDEYCGKSTLLKKLFIDAISKNNLPLFIEGNAIRNSRIEYDKIINRHVKKQYDGLDGISYVNATATKVLLLDGFDLVKGDKTSINAFLKTSYVIFDKVIITVNDTFDFSGSELLGDSYFDSEYIKYEILKLGHRLRYELVNKWNQLKEECQNENGSLIYKNNHAVRTITKVLGKNYVPSTPFFLLTLLQSMESGNALEVSANTYGYYYEYLITQSLGNASVKKEELDEFFNYVKELSYYFFDKNIKDESKQALWDFNHEFCDIYGVKIDFDNRFKLLVRAKILETKDGEYYKFKYPYVYYFFIAKYLSDTIRSESTITIIDNLVTSLGRRKSMSILMFLTHHSRDESILDKVVTQAQELFKKSKPTTLELDSTFIGSIVEKLQFDPVTYESQNRLALRKEIESRKDDVENGDTQNYESLINQDIDDDNENDRVQPKPEDNANDFLKDMNLSFKSLEILGQLSRNYYGSLKVTQKKKLLEEAIKAPLRSLDYFFSLIEENAESSLEMVEKRIFEKLMDKTDEHTEKQMKEMAKRFLFEMITSLSFFFITKISSSIGSINLQQVIDDVCDQMESNSGNLIKLATMLELGNAVSVDQLRRFVQSMRTNHLTDRLMKTIILNYLYMFERTDKEAQQICSIAGINYGQVAKQIGFEKLK
ncbi:metallophosphoesterase [Kosakonia sp. S58]|uniref:metallophosphoesterase n=1 Tax=unclassified Kosakonia TaxID=2632876 RepID=UPI0019048716|nr:MULTISPECIES: metallophosphoesterase [unclassified Kosakonia]MBK0079859.1 metallophosphoesterase [Kosakonia sp. S57]MBK0086631.1 metallophosphoesterase [Kosakonia sp. S58]